MINYTGKDLARSFRDVRGNTITIAEEIPAERYSFQAAPDMRSVGRLLAHIALAPRFQLTTHRNRVADLTTINFAEVVASAATEEAKTRTKAEIVELLRTEGEAFASFLDGADRGVPRRAGDDAAGRPAGDESALRDADVAEGARDAPSRAVDAGAADDRPGAAPDPPSAGAHGAAARIARPCGSAPKALSFLRALKRNNDRDWFKARKDQLRRAAARADDRAHRAAGRGLPRVCAGSRRQSQGRPSTASIATRGSRPNKAPLKTHVAAVFPCRGLPKHQGAGLYFEVAPDVGLGRRRHVRAGHVAAAGSPRAHRGQPPPSARHRRVAGVQALGRRARRRAAAASAARVCQRPSRRPST